MWRNEPAQQNVEMHGTYTQSIHSVDFLLFVQKFFRLYKPIFHIWLRKWYSIWIFSPFSFVGLLFYYLNFFLLELNWCCEKWEWKLVDIVCLCVLYDDQISFFLSFFKHETVRCNNPTMNNNNYNNANHKIN